MLSIKKIVSVGLFLGLFLWSTLLFATLALPNNLIALNSPQGINFFMSSDNKNNSLLLMSQFETQKNQAYCGVASAVMTLNALNIAAPTDIRYKYAYFTQDDYFTSAVGKIITAAQVAKKGMTLAQLRQSIATYPVKATVIYGSDISLSKFRQLMLKNLKDPQRKIIVNFFRAAIREDGHGHFSPIVAYNKKADRLLILDVARYKYPPFWVKTDELWQATRTLDSASGKSRGIIIIHK